MSFSIHTIYGHIFKIWRRKRFALFVSLVSPGPAQHLLDVGGLPGFWTGHPVLLGRIDTLNVAPVGWDKNSFPEYHIQTFTGDGCALDFADGSYDIAFSNSVIEHVGDWERQEAFAREIRRVGKTIWVQTPAFECPVEPHYIAPFVHWLPKTVQRKVIRWLTPWGLIEKPSPSEVDEMVRTTRLLTKREMHVLFPDCQIRTERLLGIIPKSYIAIRKSG
jgi:hypothetical protein